MRLTADVLLHAENYLNAYKDREINLRGLKIPAIENLSILQDQYDVIDLSDNDLKKVDNVPLMSRLNALLLSNNSVTRVAPQLGEHLPRLEALILTNNKIAHLYEVEHIATCKALRTLSLMENPVAFQPNYRAFVIHKMPHLKTLDFAKISKREKDDAKALFASPSGKVFLANLQQERAVYISSLEQKRGAASSAGAQQSNGATAGKAALSLTEDQRRQVKEAIEKASTKEEIDLIEYQLKTGSFAFTEPQPQAASASASASAVSTSTQPAAAPTERKPEVYSDMDVID